MKRFSSSVLIVCALSACVPDNVVVSEDAAGQDAVPSDVARDAAMPDATRDAERESGADARADATHEPVDDAAVDASPDATMDATVDATGDSASDAIADVIVESAVDSAADSAPDAIADARPDSAPDAVVDACVPAMEVCNGRDEDCDGVADNGFDLMTDRLNCGACGRACATGYACAAGRCGNEAVHVAINHVPDPTHACATLRSGEVWCWGGNRRGTVIAGVNSPTAPATRLPGISDAIATANSVASTCVLHRGSGTMGGDVTCFGTNLPWIDIAGSSRRFTGLRAVQIASGHEFVCYLKDDGRVFCLGANYYGMLGTGVAAGMIVNTWTEVAGLSGVARMATGTVHACAILDSGAVRCWGYCADLQCGQMGMSTAATPVAPMGLPDPMVDPAVELSLTAQSSCARLRSGTVYCWGLQSSYALPAPVTGVGGVPSMSMIAGGLNTHCGVSVGGDTYCWGLNTAGILGSTNLGERAWNAPTRVAAAVSGAVQMGLGGDTACAIDARGAVHCWGSNDSAQLAIPRPVITSTPLRVNGISGANRISAGSKSSCAQTATGIYCWGSNDALGVGRGTGGSSAPLAVTGLPAGAELGEGGETSHCAVAGGRAYCWGTASYIARGRGDNAPVFTPSAALVSLAPDMPLDNVARTYSFDRAHCALTTAGAAHCTGINSYANLGDGSNVFRTLMTPVTGLSSGVFALTLAIRHTCALRTDGRIVCWGQNLFGNLGDGTTESNGSILRTTPGAPVVNTLLGDATMVDASEGATCAVNTLGELYCWGDNGQGELGTGGARTPLPTRVTIPGGARVDQISANRLGFCARAGGAVYCWGNNVFGQIGDGSSAAARPLPTAAMLTNVVDLAGGQYHSCARTMVGDVYCWGDNARGQIGDGAPVLSTTSVRIVGLP